MQIHDDFEFEEKRRLYYAVYAFKLLVNEVSIEDLLKLYKRTRRRRRI